MPESDLDAIDRRIIAELQADARLSNVALADRVGLSPSPCLRRVKRLEREEYIVGYRAALRRDRVGLGFSAFVGVKIDGHANQHALKFEEAINAMPEVIACHLVSGEADYFLEVVVPDLEHYQRFLAQPSLLDAVNGVFCQLGSKKLSRFKDAAVEGPCSLDQPPTFPANRSYNPRACT